MAHSLSPPSFHSYQVAGTESQRHIGGYGSSSYRHVNRNDMLTKDKNTSDSKMNFVLSSLKGKPWAAFAESMGIASSDDETDGEATDDDPISASPANCRPKGSIVRLEKKDSSIYGYCPQTDPCILVVCRYCRMVLKAPSLKRHIDRHEKNRQEKDKKPEYSEAVVKLEKLGNVAGRSQSVDRTSGVTEKFDKITVVHESFEKTPEIISNFNAVEKVEKSSDSKRHRHFQKKSTAPSESSNDAVYFEPPSTQTVSSTTESSSASNSPQPKRRKRKHVESTVETFQSSAPASQTTCRIIVEPSEIVIRDASSPPPLAPITNEAPSVWIVTPSPAVIIDGSFVVKPLLDAQEAEPEIDLKDLKVLKPVVKEPLLETPTLLTPSNWYANQPRPLAVNTFNMRKLNAQRYVMATQRKLIELGRNLRTEEKTVGGKVPPKTWSFIERSQVFIPFRVTH